MSKVRTIGADVWKHKTDKVSLELFTLMYGSIVSQLCDDFEHDYTKVNHQLDKMGYNIGLRLIEEVLAKTGLPRCHSFRETADAVTRVGFKMFLNITPQLGNWSVDNKQFSIIFPPGTNPLVEFVECYDERARRELWYSNILAGVIRGALEMVQLSCETEFVSDVLQGAAQTELRVKIIKVLEDEVPQGEE